MCRKFSRPRVLTSPWVPGPNLARPDNRFPPAHWTELTDPHCQTVTWSQTRTNAVLCARLLRSGTGEQSLLCNRWAGDRLQITTSDRQIIRVPSSRGPPSRQRRARNVKRLEAFAKHRSSATIQPNTPILKLHELKVLNTQGIITPSNVPRVQTQSPHRETDHTTGMNGL